MAAARFGVDLTGNTHANSTPPDEDSYGLTQTCRRAWIEVVHRVIRSHNDCAGDPAVQWQFAAHKGLPLPDLDTSISEVHNCAEVLRFRSFLPAVGSFCAGWPDLREHNKQSSIGVRLGTLRRPFGCRGRRTGHCSAVCVELPESASAGSCLCCLCVRVERTSCRWRRAVGGVASPPFTRLQTAQLYPPGEGARGTPSFGPLWTQLMEIYL